MGKKKELTKAQWLRRQINRAAVIVNVRCPVCNAIPGARCFRNKEPKQRKSPHLLRVRAYQQHKKGSLP